MMLAETLNVPRGVTAFVGGGGKTTLIALLTRELSLRGKVLVSTTTRIYPPNFPILINPRPEELSRAFERFQAVAVGSSQGVKLGPPDGLKALCALADYALIEADGARGLPLKAPAVHEPVIPEYARLVVAVAGVDGIGKPIGQVHRPELYAALVEKTPDAIVTSEDAARVLCHPNGQKKGVVCSWSAVINKADDKSALMLARACARLIDGEVAITSLIQPVALIERWRSGVRIPD